FSLFISTFCFHNISRLSLLPIAASAITVVVSAIVVAVIIIATIVVTIIVITIIIVTAIVIAVVVPAVIAIAVFFAFAFDVNRCSTRASAKQCTDHCALAPIQKSADDCTGCCAAANIFRFLSSGHTATKSAKGLGANRRNCCK